MPNISTITSGVSNLGTGGALTQNSLLNELWFNTVSPNFYQNPFYYEPGILPSNWDKNFPYQLMILQAPSDDAGAYNNIATITLPYAPEALEIMAPFAISNQITFNSVVEEHAGLPTRMINLRGTFGVMPGRGTTDQISSSSSLSSIFAGTVQGISFVKTAFNSLTSPTGLTAQQPNIYKTISPTANVSPSNNSILSPLALGYTQFHLLRSFLEYYAYQKQNKVNRGWRLAFASWKDGEIYLVTPITFTRKRVFNRPLEYLYEMKLKGWKRISLSNKPGTMSSQKLLKTSPNFLQSALNKIGQARGLLQGLQDTVNGVAADADHLLFNPLRQLVFTLTVGTRAVMALENLPATLINDLTNTVVSGWDQLKADFNQIGANNISKNTQKAVNAMEQAFNATFQNNNSTSNNSQGTQNNLGFTNISPLVSSIFKNPDKYSDFFKQINLSSLKLSAAQAQIINNIQTSVANPSVQYYQNLLNNLEQFSDNYANLIGMGNSTYNNTYGGGQSTAIKNPTDEDMQVLYNINAITQQLYQIIALMPSTNTTSIPFSLQNTANIAAQNNIPFQIPISKFPIPFPYNTTLERLALQYLGDANRWIEIATLNNLVPPYIDEVGFDVPFIAISSEWNQAAISSSDNLYVGQAVWLESNLYSPLATTIQSINKVAENYCLITFDTTNDPDFDFDIENFQSLHAFLPGTINSYQYIYIPSQNTSDFDLQDELIPGVNNNDNLLAIGGVDLLLTPSNDLVITSDGAGRWVFGLNNIVQTVRIIVSTPQGSLLQHPTFGLGIPPGTNVADISAQQLLRTAQSIFMGDPAFTGVQDASILTEGPVTQITLSVALRALNKLLPITVNLVNR